MEAKVPPSASGQNTELDLSDVKGLLRDAQHKEDGQKYRKAAEIILVKILYRDPTNQEAKSLLAEAHAAKTATTSSEPPVSAKPAKDGWSSKKPISTLVADSFEDSFSDSPNPPPAEKSGLSSRMPIVLVAALALAIGAVIFTGGSPEEKPLPASQPVPALVPQSPPETEAVTAAAPSSLEVAATNTLPNPTGMTANRPSPPAAPAVATPAVPKKPEAVPVLEMGSLAVSSPIAADAYIGEKYLGSTPGTFRIPAGKQTVEYRHGDLKSIATYDVDPNETITTRVNFEIEVQVNARPWAQVYLDGASKRSLGQTPLSSVKVPVGSTLVFENPNFPSKSHRITDQDSSIQMVFP